MSEDTTKVRKFINAVQNQRILAILLIFCLVIISVASFTDSIDKLVNFTKKYFYGPMPTKVPAAIRGSQSSSAATADKKFIERDGRSDLLAEGLSIRWYEPIYVRKDSGYEVQGFNGKKNAFEIYISKSSLVSYWYVQVRSNNNIPLLGTDYTLSFEYRSNMAFPLYSRLGELIDGDGNTYKEKQWEIVGDGEWHVHRFDFAVTDKKIVNFLYFQLGKAPSGTRLELRNIRIRGTVLFKAK